MEDIKNKQSTLKIDDKTTLTEDDIERLYRSTKKSRKETRQYKYSKSTMDKYYKMKEQLASDLAGEGSIRSKTVNIYEYIAKDNKRGGKIITDTMSGFSKLDVNSYLVNEGYEVYSIQTSKMLNFMKKDSTLFGKKMNTKNLVFFLTQLSTYLKSGITLSQSMRIITEQLKKDPEQQKVMKSICYELNLGENFSAALEKQGEYFPALLINMTKAAEATGTLQETLEDMANYYTEVNNTRRQMISALTYPSIITVFSIAVLAFIIIYVVPQFTKIYIQADVEVKGLTKFIINLSDFLTANILVIILVFVLLMLLVYILYKSSKGFRTRMQMIFMKTPIVKNVIIYKELSIFSKTFASLLRNNVYITESVSLLSKVTNNEIYKAIMYKTINNIVKGEKISDAFKDHWAVPDVAYYMIVTGESTSALADMMQRVSDYYQEMHRNVVNDLKSFIEPVMIVILAILVGVIIIAVIVPMFQLYQNML